MKGSVVQNGNVISDSDDVNGEEEVENDGDTSENDALYDYENSPQRSKDVTNMPDQNGLASVKGEAEWTPADIDLLKKLMVRYPKGMLKRWEVIAESFDGSHSVESIVKMSKAMAEKKKTNDDYSDFLAKRKGHANAIASPLSLRSDSDESGGENLKSAAENKDEIMQNGDGKESQKKKKSEWSDAEDKALLNALKMFPKDTPMRWEKVALAVPTRTKPQCFRRYSQLKEGFRNKMENN
ncbi:hypothetical protein KP509_36G033600 [Ceratopteris richardii]|nr:hypothetical protein KP509_36G033600 [Ceratopteris richardii]